MTSEIVTKNIKGGIMESSRELIEKRAYELFLSRGGKDGYAMQDWLQAEQIVHAEIDSQKKDKQARNKPAEKLREKITIAKVEKIEEAVKEIINEPKRVALRNGFIALR